MRRWRDLLHAGPGQAPLAGDFSVQWSGLETLALPTGDELWLEPALAFDAPLRVHARQGGERLRLPGREHHTTLKHALQDLGVPPWERERLPLLSHPDGTLLAAGDLLLAGSFQDWLAARGTRLRWEVGVGRGSGPMGADQSG
ncbi:MAG TPA: tRNA lysidine(34) synthetase TilS [Arenimonas sp.]